MVLDDDDENKKTTNEQRRFINVALKRIKPEVKGSASIRLG